jgi:hypothetical protein
MLLPLTGLAIVAPVPKEKVKKLEDVFGEVADLKSNCKFDMMKGDALRITVPKSHPPADFSDDHPAFPPMVSKVVEGDFVLTVRVTHAPAKDAGPAAGARGIAKVMAGIALYSEADPKSSLLFTQHHSLSGKSWASGFVRESRGRVRASGANSPPGDERGKAVYLKLTRSDTEFKTATSTDGKTWEEFLNCSIDKLGAKLVVGPVALQSTSDDYEAVFDQYEIKPLKDEKK